MRIVCSGFLVRYPLGGFCWHHLQYLLGLRRLGHEVIYAEHFGWADSCYDPSAGTMSSNPEYGLGFLRDLLDATAISSCYLAEDGAVHGLPRATLADACRDADLYINLSGINWIDEFALCRRRVLVDTDPVFSQIKGFGLGGPFERYHALFTYGENVHRAGCSMPTASRTWISTRQPVVLDRWRVAEPNPAAALTTVMNWSSFEDRVHEGEVYGHKDREFPPYFDLPRRAGVPMELAVRAPDSVRHRLVEGGWRLTDPLQASLSASGFQQYIARSLGEFSVAKHAFVKTRCGWFSDRSACYLASGRPVILQDTGFSQNLPCGQGLLAFSSPEQAITAIHAVAGDPHSHSCAARRLACEHFDSDRVLARLLEQSL